ncbi:hypothetical protein [Jeongeupia chitinilytica]|uniref:Uncharacterized protein n=1 Tax=Jeongeupia chitinilytica TaxID=1041641 RepID=A0ABQ3GXD6_9NEIS|nr:hypothetical protein [Jeongeupia chitinilytica]GHD59862.1 hypothetical protein GCM10007350_11800 [Jeongeupia chitinilytica]
MGKTELLRNPKLGGAGLVKRKGAVAKKNLDWRLVMSTFAVIVAPCAYLFGHAYREGYLIEFGVDPSHFSIDITETYVNAFYAVIGIWNRVADWAGVSPGVINFLFALFVLWMFYGFAGYVLLLIRGFLDKPRIQNGWLLTKLRPILAKLSPKRNRLVKSFGYVSAIGLIVACVLYLVFVFVLVAGLVPATSYAQGAYSAKKQKSSFLQGMCSDRKKSQGNCVALKGDDGKLIASGLYVSRNEKSIAIYASGVSAIYPIPVKYVMESY